jgi:hypothetical protein
MKRSETIVEISKALYQLHKEIGKVQKDATNPFFKSKYSTLESVMETAKAPLDANGLFVTQTMDETEAGPIVETTVIHAETGEYITSSVPAIAKKGDNQMQALGSAITYARRYGLAAILGIVQEDDDGNGSVPPKNEKKPELSDGKKALERIPALSSIEKLNEAKQFIEDNKHEYQPSAYDKIMKEFDGKEIELKGGE